MTEHTSGPWQLIGSHESEGFDCYWIKAQPSPFLRGFTKDVATVTGPQGGVAEANARLIAAAPDLLAALREAREALHFHYVEWDGEPEDAVPLQLARSRCDAAIAKATGAA